MSRSDAPSTSRRPLKNVLNFVLFQLVWFAAVGGAGVGRSWLGPVSVLAFLAVHLWMVGAGGGRARELRYVLAVGVLGSLADSGLHLLGATAYPTSGGVPAFGVPLWISSLWVAFAMLPRFSMRWLAGRTWSAALFGAIGGPLSYLAGTRFGSVSPGEEPLLTWGALAVEYAIVTPCLLRFAPGREICAAEAGPALRPADQPVH